jgi:tetratricopeptide (TPR) repeat protein
MQPDIAYAAGARFRNWLRGWLDIWESARPFGKALVQLTAALILGIVFVLVLTVLVKSVTAQMIAVDPIAIPKPLSDSGYTSDVASQRLRDALNTFHDESQSGMQQENIALRSEMPDIVVPTVGISLDTIASWIRTFVHSTSRRNISGEFTVSGGQLWLRLRLDGKAFYTSDKGVDLANPDELLKSAAPYVFKEINPYTVASWQYRKNKSKEQALATIARIIAERPNSDENAIRSRNLQGSIYQDQENDPAKAKQAFVRAIELEPNFAESHNNLGSLLYNEGAGDVDAAMGEFRKAIELNPKLVQAHSNLGNALLRQGKVQPAIREYGRAIELDPKYAWAHNNLGFALQGQKKFELAIEEYGKAILLDPYIDKAHGNLVSILTELGRIDEAIAECRRFISIRPELALAHADLGLVFFNQGMFEEAIVEFQKVVELDPKNSSGHSMLGDALRKRGMIDEAISEYRKTIELDPGNTMARNNLQSTLEEKSRSK